MHTEQFDAIVVGSGFGGSVSACRLAENGRRVAVLERGKRYAPGSFPRGAREMSSNFWDPSQGLHGLFDIWSFRRIESVVASGLGGGSLIYANALIRKPEKWFVRESNDKPGTEYWPITRDQLDPYYDKAERVLGATPYPFESEPYRSTPKTSALKKAGGETNTEWFLPNLAISFGAPPTPGIPVGRPEDNLHNRQRYACRLCGECDIGCNFGSKNTTDLNYLSSAHRNGARIECRCEVRTIEWRDGYYYVHFVRHLEENEGVVVDTDTLPVETWRSKVVVLAAGTFGSTYLLLRSRSSLPTISRSLGSHFSGNGDMIGFMRGDRTSVFEPSRGPVLTSSLHVPDVLDGGLKRGFYVQDGGYPDFAGWMLETANAWGPAKRAAVFVLGRIIESVYRTPHSRISGRVAGILGKSHVSSRTLPLLCMGRDVPDGNMSLNGKWLDLDWTTATSTEYFSSLVEAMTAVSEVYNATLRLRPTWKIGNRVITVHPLGGCPMGRTIEEGVVDSYGEVFNAPGLFVCDGSVMPGPVGPNPSLTIAALAERFSERMVDRSR